MTAPTATTATSTTVTDRRGLRVLGTEECLQRLRRTPVGRLVFVSAGELVVLPVNHAVDGTSVVFRTQHGAKLQVAAQAGTVAFEVDDYDDAAETGWSVLVKGTAEMVYDDADVARYEALGLRSWADAEGRGLWVRIRAAELSGRETAG